VECLYTSRLPKQKQVRADNTPTSAARLVVSGLSLGAAGSDELPGSSRIDPCEVDVSVYAADHCAQRHQNKQNY